MQRFHIVYRYANEYVSSGAVIEAEPTLLNPEAHAEGEVGLIDRPAIVVAIDKFMAANPTAHIIAVNTQELVDLMSSARG